ncbi:response regulator transcription factor [Hydrogenophaga soli]
MHFTRREHDVLHLLSQGLNNKTMASILGISPHTVRDHISSMLQRTGCVTRTQLAMQHGQPAASAEAHHPPPYTCRATGVELHL